MGIAGTAMQKQKRAGISVSKKRMPDGPMPFSFFWHRFRSLIVSKMGSETLLLFIVALFNNSHNDKE
jgi:hypothetical protein